MATPSFNRYKIAHTLLGRSCTLFFKTVLGMKKITPTPTLPLPTPSHSPKTKKFPKTFFYFENIYLRGWGLATPSFNRYKIAHTLLGRNCTLYFENVLGMNRITPIPSPTLKIKKNCLAGWG